MRRGLSSRLALGCVCLFLVSLPGFAQKITGDIEGNITDSSGAVMPAVIITVMHTGTGLTRTATTTSSGNFRIPELPIGTYKVTATAQGFKTVTRTAEVATGGVTHSDFVLQVGQRTETVEVEGTAPLVDLSPNENNYIDSEKINEVPLNGRDFNSLLAITPGVQRAPGGGFLAISINGARTTSNNYFIDGLYNNDRYYGDSAVNQTGVVGIPATNFPPEAIEELSVQETPSAEFGVKGGAPILLGMKSGTNDFHGSATWVHHGGAGDADNYFSNHNADNCASVGECQPTPLHNNQMNGTFGGPIIKDRTFFFVYYEGQRYKATAISSRLVPTPAEIQAAKADIANNGLTVDQVGQTLLNYFPTSSVPNPNGFGGTLIAQTPTTATSNGFGIKIDHRLNTKNTITGRYIYGDSFQSAPAFAGLPAGGTNSPDLFNSIAPTRVQMVGLSWTSNLSNNKILESRLGYTRFAQIIDVNNKINPQSLGVDTGPLSNADFGVPYVYLAPLGYGGYIGGVQGYPITTRPDSTWDWSEHFSWVKGNHSLRFGGNYQSAYTNSLRNRARTGFAIGYNIQSQTDHVQGAVEELLLGRADSADRNFGDTHRHIYQRSIGFYGQDDWKVRPNLTLTFGLRWDINGALGEENNRGSNFLPGQGLVQLGQGIGSLYNLDLHDFGPRAGFAWDVFGKGKTALRGGYSLSYDVPNFGSIAAPYTFAKARAGAFSQPDLGQFSSFSVSISGLAIQDPTSAAATCYDPNVPPAKQVGDYICFSQGSVFGSNPSGSPPYDAFAVVSNFKTPRYQNFNLSVQQEVARNNVLTVGYSGQRGQNLAIYRDLNASPLGSLCGGNDPTGNDASCDQFRPFYSAFPTLRHIIQLTNQATSQYDSMQVSYNQRAWHGLDTQYNLTWSKCFDDNSVNRGGAGDYPQLNNPLSISDSRGLCDHDVRLNFNVGGVYNFPAVPKAGKYAGKGWQVSSIYTAISGRPFSALLGGGTDTSGQGLDGNSLRASYDGTPIHYNTRNPDSYVSETYVDGVSVLADTCGRTVVGTPVSPFYAPCNGTVGTSRRNQLIGPGLSQWDMSLIKETQVTERVKFQFRWEVFNILNRGNFYYLPNNTLNGGALFAITKTSDVAAGNPVIAQGGPRNMNFVLKLIF